MTRLPRLSVCALRLRRRTGVWMSDLRVLVVVSCALLLALLWLGAWRIGSVQLNAAELQAGASVRELANTYQAQVSRSLREIDLSLRLLSYARERPAGIGLQALVRHELLLPQPVFQVSVVDAQGQLLATTASPGADDLSQAIRLSGPGSSGMQVGLPRRSGPTGPWRIDFSRAIVSTDGHHLGAAVVSVDAAYFVSGYDESAAGRRGLLALIGADGRPRAARSGERMDMSGPVDLASIRQTDGGPLPTPPSAQWLPWDAEARYLALRELPGTGLMVLVGLSRSEQLAAAEAHARRLRWRAAAASLVLLLIAGGLTQLATRTVRHRRREQQARQQRASEVEHLAYHDSLTGLPNRGLFTRLLEQGLQRARRQQQPLSLLFIDLDRFKLINDTLGHAVGDELLIEVAKRLRSCLRESDTVARLAGDEFVVILEDADQHGQVAMVAGKLISTLAQPCRLSRHELRITASIGIATSPQDGIDEPTLTRHADIAMYQAKQDGKNNYRFYSPELSSLSLERMALEAALRNALLNHELELHYQPHRDMNTRRITGTEALLRWHHPELGQFEARRFMQLAESTGLIVPIGKWVLRQICEQHQHWCHQGFEPIRVAVNLSPRQLADDTLLNDLDSLLRETGMDPSFLELEIAESVLLADLDRHVRRIEQLKLRGVRITIDDFGVASAALAELRAGTVDTIKIEPRLIGRSVGSPVDQQLPANTIRIAHGLGRNVVAKGVETEAQAHFLRDQHCHALQGHLCDPPVSADRFSELLRQEATPRPARQPRMAQPLP